MAVAFAAAGFREVCCTPHRMRGVWANSAATVRAATAALQSELDRAGIQLTLHPGTEYYLDEFLPEALHDPLPLPGNLLLVELPSRCDSHLAQRLLAKVVQRGLTPLIAHPERCDLFSLPVNKNSRGFFDVFRAQVQPEPQSGNDFVKSLREIGCQFQGNLGSLKGYYGARVRENALQLQSYGCYTHWGSDAHTLQQLQAVLTSEG